jgi:hypothetical protein
MNRQLTQGEMKLVRSVFGDSINLPRVKVHDDKYIFFQPDNSGMTPNGEIYVHGAYSADYASADPDLQAFFVHEMVHVWQHQTGVLNVGVIGSAIVEMIGQLGDYGSVYPYVLDGSKDLTDYGLEQQASIVEDYFRLTKLRDVPRRARAPFSRTCSPNQPTAYSRLLYEKVLYRFLTDPTYGQRPYQRVCAPPVRR